MRTIAEIAGDLFDAIQHREAMGTRASADLTPAQKRDRFVACEQANSRAGLLQSELLLRQKADRSALKLAIQSGQSGRAPE